MIIVKDRRYKRVKPRRGGISIHFISKNYMNENMKMLPA